VPLRNDIGNAGRIRIAAEGRVDLPHYGEHLARNFLFRIFIVREIPLRMASSVSRK